MVRKIINYGHGDDTRNNFNHNFKELYDESAKYSSIRKEADAVVKEAKRVNLKNVDVQKQVDELIVKSGTSDAEVIQARIPNTGESFTVLKERLDKRDSNLLSRGVNILDFGAVGDGISNDFNALKSAISFIEDNGGVGTIVFPGEGRIYKLDFDGVNNKRPFTFTSKMKKITLEGISNPTIKLADGVTYASLFYSTASPNLEFESRNIIYDGNSKNTPKNTGSNANPKDDAQRMFEFYGRKFRFFNNEFINFAGVNIIIANRNALCVGKSRTEFIGNKVLKFGYDPSESIHDNSAFYSHTQFSATSGTDDHTVVARNNEFEGDSAGSKTNAFNAMELGGKHIFCTGNITNNFHCGVIISHQFPIHSLTISDNHFISVARGVYLWSMETFEILPGIREGYLSLNINNNNIHIDENYWGARDVYSTKSDNHRYSYVVLNENFGRNIKNINISSNNFISENNKKTNGFNAHAISFVRSNLSYSHNPSIENFTIENNNINGHPNKGIFINVPKIKNLKVKNNQFMNIGEYRTSDKRIIDIRGLERIDNLEVSENEMEMKNSDYGIYVDTPILSYFKSGNNMFIENNNKTRLGYLHLVNPATHVNVNENVPNRIDADITKLKNCQLDYCEYVTPDGTLKTDKTTIYKIESVEALTSRVYYIADKLEITTPTPGGYVNYICTGAGNKGTWKGYGKIEE